MPYKLVGGRLVFRIVLWGPEGAGKRTFLSWFGQYARSQASRTTGQLMDPVLHQAPGMLVLAMPSVPGVCWQLDTAWPGRPDSINQQVLNHADAVILVFSAEDWAWESSLGSLHALVQVLGSKITPPAGQHAPQAIPLVVCANKWDNKGTIIDIRMREALNALDLQSSVMFETIAIDGTNLRRALVHACRECVLRHYRKVSSSAYDSLAIIEEQPEWSSAHDGRREPEPEVPVPEPPIRASTTPPTSQENAARASPAVQVVEDPRIATLKSILRRAVDPEALKDAMVNFGFEKSIFNTEARSTAHYSCFRVQVIDGTPYIICPVPFLYDEVRRIEAGFAIDVDQDHFSVFAYMHDYAKKESLVLSKLPHCVHRAINLDATDYSSISDEVKEMSNETSAMFFINSLVADLSIEGAEGGAPIEFFDDKLYLQLLNRFVKVTDPRWFNHAAIGKKFDQLMRQFETLDVDDPLFENNKLRAYTNIAQFLFGISDLVTANCFAQFLDASTIQQHANTIHAYLETTDFLQFLFTFKDFSRYKVPALLELFKRGNLEISKEYALHLFDYVYAHTDSDAKVQMALDFMKSTGIVVNESTIQDLYKELYARSDICSMKRLRAISGVKPEGQWIQGLFPAIFEPQASHDAAMEKLAYFISEMDLLLDLDPVHKERVLPFLRRGSTTTPEHVVSMQASPVPDLSARASPAPAVLALSRATPPPPVPSFMARITGCFIGLKWPHVSIRPLAVALKAALNYASTILKRWWNACKTNCAAWWRNHVLIDAEQRFKLQQMRAIDKYIREGEIEFLFSRIKECSKESAARILKSFHRFGQGFKAGIRYLFTFERERVIPEKCQRA